MTAKAIDLSEAERNTSHRAPEVSLSDLREEIAKTGKHEWREALHEVLGHRATRDPALPRPLLVSPESRRGRTYMSQWQPSFNEHPIREQMLRRLSQHRTTTIATLRPGGRVSNADS